MHWLQKACLERERRERGEEDKEWGRKNGLVLSLESHKAFNPYGKVQLSKEFNFTL